MYWWKFDCAYKRVSSNAIILCMKKILPYGIDRFLRESVKHHYIPEYFIKAFTNTDGFLHVYDKEKDCILKKPIHPGNIFYEDYANSIEINGTQYAWVEIMYNGINGVKGPDDRFSPTIKEFQNGELNSLDLTDEKVSHFIYFIAQLTWRIPANKILNKIMLNYLIQTIPELRSVMSSLDGLNSDDQFKIARFITPTIIFRESCKNTEINQSPLKIIDFKNPIFCLSDNPIIWKNHPTGLDGFATPLLFPISSQKLLYFKEESDYNISQETQKDIILLLMHQAVKYVAFHDKSSLENYVEAYREYRKIGPYQRLLAERLFEKIKK